MKQILSDSSESRLETIRKIFNLDKYKLIRKNIELYNKEISARIREDKARTENMVDLSDDSERLTQEIEIIEKKILDLTDLIKKLNQNLDSKQSDLKNLNEKINIQNKLKQDIASVKSKIESMNSQKKIFEKQLMSLSDLNKSDLFEDKDELKILKDKLILLENNKDKILEKRRDVIQKKAILESRISQSKKTTEKIYSLDVCPTCKQNVTDEHKSSIKQDELNKIKSSEEKLVKLKEIYVLLESRLSSSDEKIKTIQDSITQIQIKHVKIKSLQDKLKLKEQIESNIKKIDSDLKENDKLLINFTDKLDKNLLITFDEKSKEIQKQQQVLKQNEILLSEINKERSFKKEQIKKLKEQLEQKNKIIDKISKNTVLKNWFEKFFLGLMQKMEKHTLTNIQREFNSCFQDWFNLLIEDENINVRLDDSFSPLIEQNGYETSINNLSGGEKTSVALAYRLSLNNVINSFVSNVKTKDLIILDEPTDGFSTQQLDRLRDVLLELKSNQIIIVSHESKLESYADNIIKINKEHHISKLSF
jgi:exonuclease SbcC